MVIYYLLDFGHAAVAELYGAPVENFLSLWPAGKDLSMRMMNARPMLVLTLLLYGGYTLYKTFLLKALKMMMMMMMMMSGCSLRLHKLVCSYERSLFL